MTSVFRHIPFVAPSLIAPALPVEIRQCATYGEHAYTYDKNTMHDSDLGPVVACFKKGVAIC